MEIIENAHTNKLDTTVASKTGRVTLSQVIETVDIYKIKPYIRNPRKNANSIKMLKESIVKYGFLVPLTVDKNMVIVTGHSRYFAAKALKFETLPVIVLDLPTNKLNEYRIADNATAEHTSFQLEDLGKLLQTEGYSEDEGFISFFRSNKHSSKEGKSGKTYESVVGTLAGVEVIEGQEEEVEILAPDESEEEFICPYCLHEFKGNIEQFKVS